MPIPTKFAPDPDGVSSMRDDEFPMPTYDQAKGLRTKRDPMTRSDYVPAVCFHCKNKVCAPCRFNPQYKQPEPATVTMAPSDAQITELITKAKSKAKKKA